MEEVRKVTRGRVGRLYKDLEAHTDTEMCWPFADKQRALFRVSGKKMPYKGWNDSTNTFFKKRPDVRVLASDAKLRH